MGCCSQPGFKLWPHHYRMIGWCSDQGRAVYPHIVYMIHFPSMNGWDVTPTNQPTMQKSPSIRGWPTAMTSSKLHRSPTGHAAAATDQLCSSSLVIRHRLAQQPWAGHDWASTNPLGYHPPIKLSPTNQPTPPNQPTPTNRHQPPNQPPIQPGWGNQLAYSSDPVWIGFNQWFRIG